MVRRHHALAGAVLLGFLGWAPEARAEDDGVIVLTLGITSLVIATPGIISAVGNSNDMGKDQKPSYGWRVGGFVTGGINLAAGGIFLGLVAPQGLGKIYAPAVVTGLINATVGIVDIVISAKATAMPDTPKSPTARFRVVPVAIEDIRQKTAPGIGIRVNAF
jgi:hypothetical protein